VTLNSHIVVGVVLGFILFFFILGIGLLLLADSLESLVHVQQNCLVLRNVDYRGQEYLVFYLFESRVDIRQKVNQLVHWSQNSARAQVITKHSVQVVQSYLALLLRLALEQFPGLQIKVYNSVCICNDNRVGKVV
jgi:hypothetical protein